MLARHSFKSGSLNRVNNSLPAIPVNSSGNNFTTISTKTIEGIALNVMQANDEEGGSGGGDDGGGDNGGDSGGDNGGDTGDNGTTPGFTWTGINQLREVIVTGVNESTDLL